MTVAAMVACAAQTALLRLHTADDDCVWYGDDDHLAVNSFLEAEDFLASNAFAQSADARCISLLGTRVNAPLVVLLQRQRERAAPTYKQRIRLGSPMLLPTAAVRRDPETVLHHLWQPEYRGRLHGLWHDLDEKDYCTYAMIVAGGAENVSAASRRIAVYHPAWPALSFVSTLNVDAACRLLCEIVDPRWYRHFCRQGRLTNLYAYLGLTPQNASAYLGEVAPDRGYQRALLAIKSWYDPAGLRRGSAAFLWRLFERKGGGAMGLLRGTQLFVRFLHTVWLCAVGPPHPEVVFDPRAFFAGDGEAEAYERHLRK